MHMVQHLLFTLVAAPLLVAGHAGVDAGASLLAPRARARAVWRFLTRPLVALLLFNGFLLFTHWPAVVDTRGVRTAALRAARAARRLGAA